MLAASDLQARICNIVKDSFFGRHMASADPEEQQYARVSTLYRVGDHFGWTEILRRGLQYLDLGDDRKTRELAGHLALVSLTFSDTHRYPAGAFRLFQLTFHDLLFSHGQQAGDKGGSCVIVDGSQALANCTEVIRLKQGTITAEGLTGPPPRKHLAVTGGTGIYRNAGGEGTLVEFGSTTGRLTLHLLVF